MNNLIGIVLVVVIFILVKSCNLSGYIVVDGKVTNIGWRYAGGRNRGKTFFPVIMFQYSDKTYYSSDAPGISYISTYSIGDNAKVMFPENEPENATTYGLESYWFNIPSLAILGIMIIAFLGIKRFLSLRDE